MTEASRGTSKLASAVSGAATGALVSVCVQPLDVIRTRMQAEAVRGVPQGLLNSTKTIFAEGGIRAFWRGSSATVVRLSVGLGLQFTALESLKDAILRFHHSGAAAPGEDRRVRGAEAFLAAGLARTLAAAATCPATIVKTRMEFTGAGAPAYKSMAHVVSTIVRAEGPRGLFRGLGPTVLANAPFSALYYYFYTGMQDRLALIGAPAPAVNFASGVAAAVVATLLTQPTDLIRTHMQLGLGAKGQSPLGPLATLQAVMAGGRGPRTLLAGTLPRVLKRTLQTALVWTLYEELQPRLTASFRNPKRPDDEGQSGPKSML